MCLKGAWRWSASSSSRSMGPSPLSVKGACSSLKIWIDRWGWDSCNHIEVKAEKIFTQADGRTTLPLRVIMWEESVCLKCLLYSHITCLRMFCSLMSFCRSLFGLLTMISRTSCPLLGMSTTKNTRSSRSLVTALVLYKKTHTHKEVTLHHLVPIL